MHVHWPSFRRQVEYPSSEHGAMAIFQNLPVKLEIRGRSGERRSSKAWKA